MLRAFLVTLAILLAALAALVVIRLYPAMVAGRDAGDTRIAVGRVELLVPTALLRPQAAGQAGRARMVAVWPDFTPVPAAPPESGQAGESHPLVFLDLAPADELDDPAERPMALYARFFAAENWSNPGGLLMRRFRAGTPYQEEELYFAPPDGASFAARCPRPGTQSDVGASGCLWLFRREGLDIQARFPAALLPHWDRLREAVDRLVGQWIAAGRRG